MPHIVLTGTMGSGKTTVGGALAARLGLPYWDNDAELCRAVGRTAAEVAAEEGLDRLHELEESVLRAGLALPSPAVVAAPASVALRRPDLGDAVVVWLRAAVGTLAARVGAGGAGRPDLGSLAAADAARRPGFAALADVVVDVDGRPVDAIVAEIAEAVGASGGNPSHGSVTVARCEPPQSS